MVRERWYVRVMWVTVVPKHELFESVLGVKAVQGPERIPECNVHGQEHRQAMPGRIHNIEVQIAGDVTWVDHDTSVENGHPTEGQELLLDLP